MRWDVHCVEQTGSTNRDLLALARAGAPAGTVVRSDLQTAGHGRLGRPWRAPPGSSLLASILLDAEPVPFVVVARVALAAREACRDLTGVEPGLKWPNDLLVGDRKLAGLLAEAEAGSDLVVVGIGCNVSWPPPSELDGELRHVVVALSHLAGAVPTPAQLLDALLGRLVHWLARSPDQVLAAYREHCDTLGRPVRVTLPDRHLEGVATGISPTGELEVTVGGRVEVVRAGDVVHVRPR